MSLSLSLCVMLKLNLIWWQVFDWTGVGSGANTQRIVAVVLGGIVGVGLLVAALLFVKSVLKKRVRSKHAGG